MMPNILICDDDEVQYEELKEVLLKDKEYNIFRSVDVRNILFDLEQYRPIHLLILDLDFKRKDPYEGMQSIEKIKKQFPGIKIIIYTSHYQSLLSSNRLSEDEVRELFHKYKIDKILSRYDKAETKIEAIESTIDIPEISDIWILHLSDFQFGGKGIKESGDDLFDSIWMNIQEYVKSSSDIDKLQFPFLSFLTGDLSENGRPNEFKNIERFISKNIEALKNDAYEFSRINKVNDNGNIFIIPGNHDRNWDILMSGNIHKEDDKEKDTIYKYLNGKENFRPELSFLNEYSWFPFINVSNFTRAELGWVIEPGYKVINFSSELGIIIVLLNSSKWRNDVFEHFGSIPYSVFGDIAHEIKKIDKDERFLKILLVHHSMSDNVKKDNDKLCFENDEKVEVDRAKLINMLNNFCKFSLVFTGHAHNSYADYLEYNDTKNLIHIGASTIGSFDKSPYADISFNLVRITDFDPAAKKYRRCFVHTFSNDGSNKYSRKEPTPGKPFKEFKINY